LITQSVTKNEGQTVMVCPFYLGLLRAFRESGYHWLR
jgi:hypothetical protein